MPSASQVSGIADDALKSELRKTWENAAPGWAKWEHIFSAGLSDATDTLIDMAGIQPGMLTLHPQGIHHGPQPNAVEASKAKTHTTEVAVMIESKRPFTVDEGMDAIEIKDYALSWSHR